MKVKFINNQPIIDIDSRKFGLNRDRNPDFGWNELRWSNLEEHNVQEIDISLTMNLDYKIILIEDLAFAYGQSSRFKQKLIEFNLI